MSFDTLKIINYNSCIEVQYNDFFPWYPESNLGHCVCQTGTAQLNYIPRLNMMTCKAVKITECYSSLHHTRISTMHLHGQVQKLR